MLPSTIPRIHKHAVLDEPTRRIAFASSLLPLLSARGGRQENGDEEGNEDAHQGTPMVASRPA
ncbi:MAG: hypothetical protein QNJ98_15655 [Planctomycetota bacterium]|nr:hypothetical protein [Planctomycetota bacterium]